jgi:hypothetical protein
MWLTIAQKYATPAAATSIATAPDARIRAEVVVAIWLGVG